MIHSLRNQSIFRTTSRPPSPSIPPDSLMTAERAQSPTRVPFQLRRSSWTPVTSPTRTPLVQDGSYLQALGLRLNEAVSKALAQPSGLSQSRELVDGRCPIPAGRARALGDMIEFELQSAGDNEHLYRAVLRALQKPLSVLLTNLSGLLLPLLSSPAFLQPPALTLQMPAHNATQLHALAIADFAGELLSSFNDLALGINSESRGDGLQPIRAGLVSVVGRVISPLIARVRDALIPIVDAFEVPAETTPRKAKGSIHPSITALQSSVPAYGRALTRYASLCHSDALLASFLICVVWRALVALSYRSVNPSSPPMVLSEKASSPRITSATSPAGLFNLKRGLSWSASPVITSTVATDAKALYEIFSHLPRPTHTQVAREAVDEAFVHLGALASLLEIADDLSFVTHKTAEEVADEIYRLTDELPTLIALPVLLRMQHLGSNFNPHADTVAALLNIPEDIYRRDYLAGFGRAERSGPVVAQRILDEIYAQPIVDPSSYLVDWLEARLGQNDY